MLTAQFDKPLAAEFVNLLLGCLRRVFGAERVRLKRSHGANIIYVDDSRFSVFMAGDHARLTDSQIDAEIWKFCDRSPSLFNALKNCVSAKKMGI